MGAVGAEPMITDNDRADALDLWRERLTEFEAEVAGILDGAPAAIRERARAGWLGHLDRMLGVEDAATIEDTVADLRRLTPPAIAITLGP